MASSRRKSKASKAKVTYWIRVLANFGLLASIVAILLMLFSGLGTRWEWWGFRDGLKYFRYSAVAGAAGLLLCVLSMGWGLKARKFTSPVRTWTGLLIGLLTVGNFLVCLYQALSTPPIHDITTDFNNPPAFEALLPYRKGALNPPEYGGPRVAELQQKAYTDIQPLLLDAAPEKAWETCVKVAQKLQWDIVLMDEPRGRIEATDQTFWFGFKDDIVVRVTPQGNGSRVDMRSESRVGLGDEGTNAKRIRRFLQEVLLALGR